MATSAERFGTVSADTSEDHLEPVDISHHYSFVTKNRHRTFIKGFYKYFRIPNIGQLAGGLPNYKYFPFDTLEACAALPNHSTSGEQDDEIGKATTRLSISDSKKDDRHSRVLVPRTSKTDDALRKIDVKSALQYGTSQGYPPLYSFVRQFALENMHPNVPYKPGPEIVLTAGATDGFSKSIEALSNAWSERDTATTREGIMVEEFAYSLPLQAARARGMNIVPVAVDDQGMSAEGSGGLSDVLEHWDFDKGKRPHLIYTITIGQNPTSGVLSVARRKAIYAMCVKYDILIIEDDPYWFLQYPSACSASQQLKEQHEAGNKTVPIKSSGYSFLDSLVPSYLSIDYQGRVIRLDTFSKTVAPGCRLGWITAQPALCERLFRITDAFAQQPSGFVQSVIAELIIGPPSDDSTSGGGNKTKGWQTGGWVRWLEGLRDRYEWRMNTVCDVLEGGQDLVITTTQSSPRLGPQASERAGLVPELSEYVHISKIRIYNFTRPRAGMFIWIHIHFPTHPVWPSFSSRPGRLSKALFIFLTTPKYRVVITPGEIFAATEDIKEERAWQYFRVCFGAVDEEVLEGMSWRLKEGIQAFWGIEDVEVVERLLEEGEGDEGVQGVEGEGSLVGMGC
ncbi:uncharacterized protein KY384_005323 [Bacidia gigantensis]|uniref:uncharacterized protein n=1 Tax=Bacidia gigantensis TaxID=2732470 RepID=UPI001D03F4F1|nr:uncharacterized protein KY384_005323 [Bacidia gigantensis]KAG8529842.1 hypothetical protein KY384_005323 [Bacidia gigantensis]